MALFFGNFYKTKGTAPGSLVFVGDQKVAEPEITKITYHESNYSEKSFKTTKALLEDTTEGEVCWININGLHNIDLVKEIGEHFNINALILEDILNTEHSPKYEEVDDFIFIILKMLMPQNNETEVASEQVSFLLSKNILITFQEKKGDVFEPVRERLRKPTTKIRTRGVGYLMYALMDTIVDNYIFVTESFGEIVEDLEQSILEDSSPERLNQIKDYKKEINFLRKSIRPARECIMMLDKTESTYIDADTHPFIDDLVDHINTASEGVETYREMLSDQLNIFQIVVSNRLNEMFRILTIFSVVFIPLTFLAGIYGMNFEFIPELKYKFSYPVLWGVFLLITLGMLYFFKRKKWL